MFIEFSRAKVIMLSSILIVLVSALIVFSVANGAWSIVPQANYTISRQKSGLFYWLFYRLTGNSAAAYVPAPEGNARSIPVLLYHGEGDTSTDMPLSVFVDQLRTLKNNGWRTVTMKQYDQWSRGEIQLPDKSFLLTFDDGRKDTFYQADPVLEDMGFTGVMFVITGFSLPENGKDSNFYLNKTELSQMLASGRWELQSHGDLDHAAYEVQSTTDLSQAASTTDGHFLSNIFWNEEADRFETRDEYTARITADLHSSRQTLEEGFGITADAFAYPFNDFGETSVNFPGAQQAIDAAVPQIYSYAFYQTWRQNGDTFNYAQTNNGPGSSAYMQKRIEPGIAWSGSDLLMVLDDGSAKPLPYERDTFGSEWAQVWGSATTTAAGFDLAAMPDTSGADAFLNGSGWWTDYYFAAAIDWKAGSSVSLIARNQNDSAYVSCAFSGTSVSIQRRAPELQVEIASERLAGSSVGSVAHLGISVRGTTITCYKNGIAVATASSSKIPTHGGIGIEIWNKQLSVAHVIVQSIAISASAPAQAVRPQASATVHAAPSPAFASPVPVATTALITAVVVPTAISAPVSAPTSTVRRNTSTDTPLHRITDEFKALRNRHRR